MKRKIISLSNLEILNETLDFRVCTRIINEKNPCAIIYRLTTNIGFYGFSYIHSKA